MGEAWVQRYQSYFLEDQVGEERVLECYYQVLGYVFYWSFFINAKAWI